MLLAVNMQTSFMHPPFGFALFYLRSVAPIKAYFDKPTQKEIQPVTTMQIYWGAVPFIVMQLIMVSLIIAFPVIVSSGLEKTEVLSDEQVQMEMMNATHSNDPSLDPAAAIPAADGALPEDDPMKMMQESMNKDEAGK